MPTVYYKRFSFFFLRIITEELKRKKIIKQESGNSIKAQTKLTRIKFEQAAAETVKKPTSNQETWIETSMEVMIFNDHKKKGKNSS